MHKNFIRTIILIAVIIAATPIFAQQQLPEAKSAQDIDSNNGLLTAKVDTGAAAKLSGELGSLGVRWEERGAVVEVGALFTADKKAVRNMSGLWRGDVLLEINGRDMLNAPLSDIYANSFGEPGTPVTVLVRRSSVGNYLELTLKRQFISTQEITLWVQSAMSRVSTRLSGIKPDTQVPAIFTQKGWEELLQELAKDGEGLNKSIEALSHARVCNVEPRSDPVTAFSWAVRCSRQLLSQRDPSDIFARDEEVLSFIVERVPLNEFPEGLTVSGFKKTVTPRPGPYGPTLCPDGNIPNYRNDRRWGGMGIGLGHEPTLCAVEVKYLFKGTPAASAGLMLGDLIVAIDGTSIIGMSLQDSMTRLRGEPGTSVELTVLRNGVKGFLTFHMVRVLITRDDLVLGK